MGVPDHVLVEVRLEKLYFGTLPAKGVFHNLPVAGAAALILANERRRFASDAAAMLLVGIALQIKYSVVFEGVFFGLWIMWRLRQGGMAMARVMARGVVLASVALLPTAAAAGYYAAIGQGAAFAYANFFSIAARKADPWTVQAGNLAHVTLLLAPLIGMAVAAGTQALVPPNREIAKTGLPPEIATRRSSAAVGRFQWTCASTLMPLAARPWVGMGVDTYALLRRMNLSRAGQDDGRPLSRARI